MRRDRVEPLFQSGMSKDPIPPGKQAMYVLRSSSRLQLLLRVSLVASQPLRFKANNVPGEVGRNAERTRIEGVPDNVLYFSISEAIWQAFSGGRADYRIVAPGPSKGSFSTRHTTGRAGPEGGVPKKKCSRQTGPCLPAPPGNCE
jgi:hypothetical protein